ncbi:MAG: nicotinamide-nucleotide amidohydrolase family protein [Bacteriovorax sp.]
MLSPLNVSMIVIGDEILNGRTTDLNGSFLSKYLFKKGLHFKALRFIHDDADEIHKALSDSLNESDIVITSGGIGPTLDDLTKNILANFFGKKIIERKDVEEIVIKNYERFGRSWTPALNHYHFFPEDFTATNNPKGLAPGLAYFDQEGKKLIMAGPGVPREFTEIVDLEFLPLMKTFFGNRFLENHQTVIRSVGVPEEKIFSTLCPTLWSDLETFGKVSSLPQSIGIDIVISYNGNELEHEKKQNEIKNLIEKTPLAPHVWHYGNKEIHELVLEKAIEKKLTFAFAESCTGGLVSSKITDIPGSSEVFMGAIVSYSNGAKNEILGVDKNTIEQFGAVSVEVAREMALGALDRFNVDFAVSLTGIAGPGGEDQNNPVGTVVIGFAGNNVLGTKTYHIPGDRIKRKDRFSDMALLLLLDLILEKLK